jgi:Zn-finger nucleic acid-binding protein
MSAYRDVPLMCPACAELMEEREAEEALVDVCPACKGLWIEWFDGELGKVAREMPPMSFPTAATRTPQNGCPSCKRALYEEVAIQRPYVTVARCGECAGAFVTREAFDVLAAHAHADDEPPPDDEERSLYARLAAFLRRVFAA